MQGRRPFLGPGLARGIDEERQKPAYTHNRHVYEIYRRDAQEVSQAGQQHGSGLSNQRAADGGRYGRIARPSIVLRVPARREVGERVQELRGHETAKRHRAGVRRAWTVPDRTVQV
jgi:hypothetical protein